jgi:TIR domain
MGVVQPPIKVFYCYAHADKELRDELSNHLAPLKRTGRITDWYDREIEAGTEWESEIQYQLNTADMILLLVSSDFFASKYCYTKEMQRTIERHQTGQVRVIPVIIRPVDWLETPIAQFQALPAEGKPVTQWSSKDEAWVSVVHEISAAVETLLGQEKRLNSPHQQQDLAVFHNFSDIPLPSRPYIAHPYTLLQTNQIIGRQVELNILTNWVTDPQAESYQAHILNIVAIGGNSCRRSARVKLSRT